MNDKAICIRCVSKYQLEVQLMPYSVKSWREGDKLITNRKYHCLCGCTFERTTVEDLYNEII